jgi:hypothetical protein
MTIEMHSFDAEDGYTGEWGVWDHESCCICGKRLIVVAPINRLPATLFCSGCDPVVSGEAGLVG